MVRDDWTEEKLLLLNEDLKNYDLVCGIDEVGRGPIAGPVVACAIVMPKEDPIIGVTDSKKLSEKKRNIFYDMIINQAKGWGIGLVDEKTIDEINIRQATLLAMKTALEGMKTREGLPLKPDLVLVDAETIETDIPQIGIIKGDLRNYTIACASIIAKVTRDRLMIEYGKNHPAYLFEKHKGYGTKAHYEAIKSHGLLPIHRRSFIHGEDLFINEQSFTPADSKETPTGPII